MGDFTATMAQMIAASRPQFQVQQGHVPVVPSYGGKGLTDSSADKKFEFNVTIPTADQINATLGRPTRMQRTAMAEAAYQTYNFLNTTMDKAELERIVSSPDYQSRMAKWHSDGHPAILSESDEFGNSRYKWIPGPPDKETFTQAMETAFRKENPQAWASKMGGGATAPQIGAGMYGPEARDRLVESEGVAAENQYVAKARAERDYMHPAQVGHLEAQTAHSLAGAQNEEAMAGLNKERTKQAPVELDIKKQELAIKKQELSMGGTKTKAEIERLQADTNRLDAETNKLIRDASVDPLAKQGALEANKAFDSFYQAFTNKNANLPDNETTNLRKNTELGGAVLSHIQSMREYMGDGKASARSMIRWFTAVDREFDRETLASKYKKYSPFGPSTSDVASQQSIRQRYFSMALDMVQTAGGMDPSARDKIYKWGRAIGYPDTFIQKKLREALANGQQAPQQPQPQPQPQPPQAPPSIMLPEGRAEGGPVEAGKPYVVGEKEPEVFVPEQDGTIIPSATPNQHPSTKAFIEREDRFTAMLNNEIDYIDQSIAFAKSKNPGHIVTPELLERRQQLQEMLGKQQERMMRVHGKHMSTYQKDDKKDKDKDKDKGGNNGSN